MTTHVRTARWPVRVAAGTAVSAAILTAMGGHGLEAQTFRSAVDLIALEVQVRDKSGRLVDTLDPRSFEVTRYHSLIVERSDLPSDLQVTAETDGLVMGLQHRVHPVYGVQFHPESIASEHGHALLANFLDMAGIAPRRRNAKPARHAA